MSFELKDHFTREHLMDPHRLSAEAGLLFGGGLLGLAAKRTKSLDRGFIPYLTELSEAGEVDQLEKAIGHMSDLQKHMDAKSPGLKGAWADKEYSRYLIGKVDGELFKPSVVSKPRFGEITESVMQASNPMSKKLMILGLLSSLGSTIGASTLKDRGTAYGVAAGGTALSAAANYRTIKNSLNAYRLLKANNLPGRFRALAAVPGKALPLLAPLSTLAIRDLKDLW